MNTLEDQRGTYKSPHLERKMIFQTPMIMFHVNLQGWIHSILGNLLLVLFSPLASNPYRWTLQVQGFLLETVTAEIQAEKQKKQNKAHR